MKQFGSILMIAGILIVLVAWFIFPTGYPLNGADTEMPAVTITGTGKFPWKMFAGVVILAIGMVFRFAESMRQKPNSSVF